MKGALLVYDDMHPFQKPLTNTGHENFRKRLFLWRHFHVRGKFFDRVIAQTQVHYKGSICLYFLESSAISF